MAGHSWIGPGLYSMWVGHTDQDTGAPEKCWACVHPLLELPGMLVVTGVRTGSDPSSNNWIVMNWFILALSIVFHYVNCRNKQGILELGRGSTFCCLWIHRLLFQIVSILEIPALFLLDPALSVTGKASWRCCRRVLTSQADSVQSVRNSHP